MPDCRGIVRHETSKMLWSRMERFPRVDNRPQRRVKLGLAEAILSDGIPQTRDTMQGSLVEAVRITGPCSERCRARNRYERIRMAGNLQTIAARWPKRLSRWT